MVTTTRRPRPTRASRRPGPPTPPSSRPRGSGDERAFGRLFDQWFDPVFDVAWRILRDQGTAAEVAQDVFLVAWQRLGDLEQPGSFGGWVRRIARNRALNRLDRERRSRPDSEAAAATLDRSAPDVDMTAALGEREQNELVWAAAAALGERDTSLLDLHLRHGLERSRDRGRAGGHAQQRAPAAAPAQGQARWSRSGPGCCGGAAAHRAPGSTGRWPMPASRRSAPRPCGSSTATPGTAPRARNASELRLAPEALFAVVPIGVAPADPQGRGRVGAGGGRGARCPGRAPSAAGRPARATPAARATRQGRATPGRARPAPSPPVRATRASSPPGPGNRAGPATRATHRRTPPPRGWRRTTCRSCPR